MDNLLASKHVEWIDIAKGIGILLVLLGHICDKHTALWNFITLFHMPLFYILSGLVLKINQSISQFLKNKLITLYIPYVCIALIVYFIGIPLGDETISVLNVIKILLMLYTPRMIGAAWFICCLFYSELLLKIMFEIKAFIASKFGVCAAKIIFVITSIAFAIVGYNIIFPLGGSRILICTFFLCIGNSISDIVFIKRINAKSIGVLCGGISLVIFGILFFVISRNHYSSYSSNTFSNIVISFVSAIAGSGLVYFISIFIEKLHILKKPFLFLGVKTIGIVYFQFIAFKFVNLIIVKTYNLNAVRVNDFPVNYDYNSMIWSNIYIFFGVLISIVLYEVFAKILRWIENIIIKKRIV